MRAYAGFIRLFPLFFLACFIPRYSIHAATLHVPSEFSTIQSAINASSNGDSILVAQGTYREHLTISKNIILGSLYMTTGDQIYISTTRIDGAGYGTVIQYFGVDSTAKLCGFTIQHGWNAAEAGGIYCTDNSNPILSQLLIKNNEVSHPVPFPDEGGAGISCENNSSPVIRYCSIFNNKSERGGSIAFFDSSTARIENCHIWGNTTDESGGGIYLANVSATIENCVIRGNSCGLHGGGIVSGVFARIVNSLIIDNTSAIGAGISAPWHNALELINVSIIGNNATKYGGAVYSLNQSVSLYNCILWNNFPQEVYHASTGELGIEYSDVKNGAGGILDEKGNFNWSDTNTDLDPGFNVANGMAYIRDASSPVINSGNPDTTGLGLPPLDLAGNPRIIGGRIDMGAFEYSGSPHELLPPEPRFLIYPDTGTTATTFIFDAYPTTDNMDSLWGMQFRWDWQGDGAWDTHFSYDYVGEHAFSHAGTYTVTLEVKDSDGLTSTIRKNLTIGPPMVYNFNEEISFTIPGEQSMISVPFPDAVISLRFLFGDVMGKTIGITAFGSNPPQNVHNGPRFESVIGYYSIFSGSVSSFTGTLAVAYTDSALQQSGIAEEDLELAYWDDKTRKWNALITTVDTAANKASASIDHLSLWALTDRSDDLITGVGDDEGDPATVASYQLYQNYPNPFNPVTSIRFDLPNPEQVRVAIYNILGQRVRLLADESFSSGQHTVTWNGRDDANLLLSSGIYIYEIRAGEFVERKKMTLLR